MPIPFLNSIDLTNNQVLNARLQNLATAPTAGIGAGQIYFNTGVSRPSWYNGSAWVDIYPSDTAATNNTDARRDGTGGLTATLFTGPLSGLASSATILATGRDFSITGKATATAINFNGSGAVALNVTALTVAAGDIGLTNGSFLVGNASNVAAATLKSNIPISGFGAAGTDVSMGGYSLTNVRPTTSADGDNYAVTKGYVDSLASGLDVRGSCRVATTIPLPTNTRSGNVITATSVGALTVDGVAVVAGDRILVKDEATPANNGIYTVTNPGAAGSAAFTLTRASDFDDTPASEVTAGAFTFIEAGSTWADTGWVLTTNNPITVNSTGLAWTQFTGAGSITVGNGITRSGNTLNFYSNSGWATGDLFYGASATTLGVIAAVATGNALISGGAGAAPTWGKISASTLAQIAGLSILGTASSGAAVTPSAITGTTNQVLRVDSAGSALGFGAINIASSAAVTGTLPAGNGGTGNTFFSVAGPTAARTYTFKDLASNIPAHATGSFTADGSAVIWAAVHSLNTKNLVATLIDSATDLVVYTDTKTHDLSTVRFTFALPPANGTVYRWTVVGF
jgi:hypothetical protein